MGTVRHKLVTAREAAKVLNMHPRSVLRSAREGRLPKVQLSKRNVRFDLEEITKMKSTEQLLDENDELRAKAGLPRWEGGMRSTAQLLDENQLLRDKGAGFEAKPKASTAPTPGAGLHVRQPKPGNPHVQSAGGPKAREEHWAAVKAAAKERQRSTAQRRATVQAKFAAMGPGKERTAFYNANREDLI